jgi:integrative and conjugative element protein (TIGR02256 family)
MNDPIDPRVKVTFYRGVIASIFAECDRFDSHETGGALIGIYRGTPKSGIEITVQGVIGAGPNATRTATSFFKDGDYQERIFREIERKHPQVEHLGNWHTHHMNGYPTLSRGDRATYHRNVNSDKHNTDFFYAFLVTESVKPGSQDHHYGVKHFILYRGDPLEYELAASQISTVDKQILVG